MKKKALLFLLFFAWTAVFVYPGVLVITHPDTPVASLEKKEVKHIFTGKKTRWNNQQKIVLATLENSGVHREFLRQYLKKSPAQFRNLWRQKVFTGEGKSPKTFKDEAALVEFVAGTKGAVGYISSPPQGKPVKIIKIAGVKGEEKK